MKDKILELEERLRLAMLHSDTSVLDQLLSSTLLFTNHLGALVSKEQDLQLHKSQALKFSSIELSDSHILEQNDSAVVSVKTDIKAYYNKQYTSESFRFTRLWGKTSGEWQVLAAHASIIS
ncbi:nuclear transport factor 2 family protein [Agaribacterium haliotis]|uniref:nuclear transport factor 2 family protein n=1 Tax=Agaribacterium haliotis TaxID=2013869 RepID=UPI000BB584C4|nr:nuclear transport factor 2 family protein [Agaribacterium haliotis]